MENTLYDELLAKKRILKKQTAQRMFREYTKLLIKIHEELPEDKRKELEGRLESLLEEYSNSIKKQTKLNRGDIREILNTDISDIGLSSRAYNCLNVGGVKTVKELVEHTEERLLLYRFLGETTLNNIKKKLREYGLHLGMETEKFYK